MAENKNLQDMESGEVLIEKAKDFWTRYNKPLLIASTTIILLIGGWYGYQQFIQKPKESKAIEAMFKAEEYFRMDSIDKALNGDGQHLGFLKVADKFGGTQAGELAHFYAGSCYIKLNENEKAISYLKKFSTSSKPVQARAYKLMGDAYADMGKNADALSSYKKAARHFEKDKNNSAEYLFHAAYLADKVMQNSGEAVALYKEIKKKYPRTQQSFDADNYLAQLGVYSTEE